jgi:hypothetical protein
MQTALTSSSFVVTPIPTGPSSVGARVVQLVDSSRKDPYVANGTMRELLVRFWYPASLAEGCKPAEYTSPRVWSYFSELIGVRLPVVTTNSCVDAPVVDGQHPIVVFTHGYTGTFTDYSSWKTLPAGATLSFQSITLMKPQPSSFPMDDLSNRFPAAILETLSETMQANWRSPYRFGWTI